MSNKRSQSSHPIPPDLIFFPLKFSSQSQTQTKQKFHSKKLFLIFNEASKATKMKNADELKMDGKFYDQIDLYICSKEEKKMI